MKQTIIHATPFALPVVIAVVVILVNRIMVDGYKLHPVAGQLLVLCGAFCGLVYSVLGVIEGHAIMGLPAGICIYAALTSGMELYHIFSDWRWHRKMMRRKDQRL